MTSAYTPTKGDVVAFGPQQGALGVAPDLGYWVLGPDGCVRLDLTMVGSLELLHPADSDEAVQYRIDLLLHADQLSAGGRMVFLRLYDACLA